MTDSADPARPTHPARRLFPILLFAILYAVLFILPAMLAKPRLHYGWHTGFYSFAYVFCLLLALSIHRWLWRIGLLVLCVGGALAQYMTFAYGADILKETMTVFFEATPREVDSFTNAETLASIAYGMALAGFGIWLLGRQKPAALLVHRTLSLIAALVCFAMAIYPVNLSIRQLPPYNFISASYEYWRERTRFIDRLKHRYDISEEDWRFTPRGATPLVVVLVIGESARADHFSLNGYERETNPLLKNQPNLVNFSKTTSCWVATAVSVPCLLTRATRINKKPISGETSLISVFNKLGFESFWYGAQGTFSVRNPISAISHEANNLVVLEPSKNAELPLDEELLPYLDQALRKEKPLLIILHSSGSHFQYIDRYPKTFERFSPVCRLLPKTFMERVSALTGPIAKGKMQPFKKKMDQLNKFIQGCDTDDGLINGYDNTILYTDWFLNEVIERLKNHNALMVFASDHGESLGENGLYLHVHTQAWSNWHVPMLWWASDAFIASHPKRWNALKVKASRRVSHDNIFHSLLDCAGVKSKLIDKSLSFCHQEELSTHHEGS